MDNRLSGALNLIFMLKRLSREEREIESEAGVGLMVIFFSKSPCFLTGYKLSAKYT